MIDPLGSTRRQLLETMRGRRDGVTIDELAEALTITRTAVVQHMLGLERDGYVQRGDQRPTSGRPVQTYLITEDGLQQFPKQYPWLAKLMIEVIARDHGANGLNDVMRQLGRDAAANLVGEMVHASTSERIDQTAAAMRSLGYEATSSPVMHRLPVIEAHNCVFHELALERNEVCEFDLALLEGLTGARVEHQACIVRGGTACRFQFTTVN
ncbi:MAG: transcriptional regulator, partial [Proteobacteria bacterium]|nr:transcriptional regulator [Pseudomonadota bacterium]